MIFESPKFLDEALKMMDSAEKPLKICAGMTHVLRFYEHFPKDLDQRFSGVLHVGNVASLGELRDEGEKYALGATTRISQLAVDAYLNRYAPAVADAARLTSTPQVRNRRTVGGELAWGSFHSPLITALLAFDAHVKVRWKGKPEQAGREELIDLSDFYEGEWEREDRAKTRKPKTLSTNLLMKVAIPRAAMHRPGAFSFFRALAPKISTENSGVVLSVRGLVNNGMIQEARVVASGRWLSTMDETLPLSGVRMSDAFIFEKLYSFCERYSFEKVRRMGPVPDQLGLVVFGLLKEGFSSLLHGNS